MEKIFYKINMYINYYGIPLKIKLLLNILKKSLLYSQLWRDAAYDIILENLLGIHVRNLILNRMVYN